MPRKYRKKPTTEEAAAYAEIIAAFRSFLKLTAIDDDLHLRRSAAKIPQDSEDLAEWCRDIDHLDWAAEAVRRTMGVYLPTARIFAMQKVREVDWDAVAGFLDNCLENLARAIAFIEIEDRKGEHAQDLVDLETALLLIREIRDFGFVGIMPDSSFEADSIVYRAARLGEFPAKRAAVSAASRQRLPEAEASVSTEENGQK